MVACTKVYIVRPTKIYIFCSLGAVASCLLSYVSTEPSQAHIHLPW